MNPEKLTEILTFLSHFPDTNNFINYYELFGFQPDMTASEIMADIKKMRLQVLFHPDQIAFIPAQYQEKYLQMIDIIKQMLDDFSSDYKKENYDQRLHESLYTSENMDDTFGETEDLEELKLRDAIIFNSAKYGFEFTRSALLDLMRSRSIKGFTRDHNARDIVASISYDKIMSIFSKSSLFDTFTDLESMIMNYLTDIMYKDARLKAKIDSLENACMETMCKYDLVNHRMQTQQALNLFALEGDASAFTNNHNARTNLISNVDFKDITFLIQCLLNHQRHEDKMLNYQNTKNLDIISLNGTYCGFLYRKMMTNHYQDQTKAGFNR